ncbi:MAG: helix-turn-helix domain-containing protein [Collinsella sp.]|nr:helix-turn-helix domain-containing protein [Collinsella sp.]
MDYLIIELETLLLKAGKSNADLIRATGHTPANISKLRNGKVKAIRLKTLLDICEELDCQPGDIIRRVSEEELEALAVERARNGVAKMKGDAGGAALPTNVYAVDLSSE